MTVQSGLGQPLRAEVEVTSLSRDEAASLSARLAPPEAFRQAGLEFNSALAGLRFAIDRRPDGRAFVRISSNQPINEPFVDLLVELNWSTGKFVREYTFLLDPPELRSSREVVEGGNVQPSAVVPPAAAPAPAPSARPQAVPAARPEAARAEPVAKPAARPAAPGELTVKTGDTLAGIANRQRPQGVSLDQAMVSIYQANPSAFFGSIHQLKAGVTLAVPDQAAMESVDAQKAREQVRVQTHDFQAYRARLAEGARSVPAAAAGQSAAGSVTAKVEDKGAAAASRDQLKLSKSEAGAAPAAAGATGSSASKSATAEQSVARDAALREQQSRVAELEKNVSDLQRLLELKNKQLADVQKQLDDARNAGKAASGAIAKVEPPAAAPAPLAKPLEAPKPEAAKPEPAPVEPPKAEAPKAEAPKAEAPAAPVAEPPKAPEAKPAEAPKPAVAKAPASEPGFVDDLMSNPLMLPGLGAILALGAGYGWYAMRRRKKVEKFEDSLIAADGFATNSLFGSTGGQSVDTSNSVFTASTKDSGVDVHSTEVDPIAEAEVYIAYGREAQAEEILKEALKRQPERQAIRAKLLEIYSGRKDAHAFNTLAAEMYEMAGGQNEEWPKVVTLGLALDPENPLYTGKGPVPAAEDHVQPAEPVAGAAVMDDTAASAPVAEAAPAEPVAEAAPAEDEVAVDFGVLNAGARFEETQPLADEEVNRKSAEALAEDEIPSLDFDLDLDTTIGKAGGMLAATREGEPARSELERAVEGKFDLPTLDLPAADAQAAPQPEELAVDDLDIDLPALEELGGTVTAPKVVAPAVGAMQAPEIDLSAIGLDLEPSPAPGGASTDGIRWQEMATKLDLASAYEEIGDKEGARELLEEVIKGGDTDQQHKARSMLAKIA